MSTASLCLKSYLYYALFEWSRENVHELQWLDRIQTQARNTGDDGEGAEEHEVERGFGEGAEG